MQTLVAGRWNEVSPHGQTHTVRLSLLAAIGRLTGASQLRHAMKPRRGFSPMEQQ